MKKAWAMPVAILIGAGALSGCVNVRSTPLDYRYSALPARHVSEVIVFTHPGQITGPVREIALLESDADGNSSHERDFIEAMRRRAARLGANAILLEPGLEPTPSVRVVGQLLGVQYRRYRHARALLIERR